MSSANEALQPVIRDHWGAIQIQITNSISEEFDMLIFRADLPTQDLKPARGLNTIALLFIPKRDRDKQLDLSTARGQL